MYSVQYILDECTVYIERVYNASVQRVCVIVIVQCSVQCTMYIEHVCTMRVYSVQYSVQCTVYSTVYSTVNSEQCILNVCLQCMCTIRVYSVKYILNVCLHCTLYTVHCTHE